MAQVRQARLDIATHGVEVQADITPRQGGKILHQQTLTPRVSLPVQALFRVARLVTAQALEVITALAQRATALLFAVVCAGSKQWQIGGQGARIDQHGLVQIDPTPGQQNAQRKTTLDPQAAWP